jgi:hypothetical protein
MTRDFLPYEQAVALRDLGFDEPGLGYYLCRNSAYGIDDLSITTEWIDLFPYDSSSCKAPTFSQAFRWFREKFRLKGEVNTADMVWSTWSFNIELKGSSFFFYSGLTEHNYFNSYEEAQLACLNKLIEIIKTKQFA